MRRPALIALAILAPACHTATAAAWKPPAPKYGVKEVVNHPFTLSDGTQLVGSVYYPADLKTGEHADGRFPVMTMMTPYGMWDGTSTVRPGADDQILRYFASHGYIGLEMDVRGAGRSEGEYSMWEPLQMRDYTEVIDYAAHGLDGSNGKVGLAGMSYRGMNQLLVGGVLKPGTPVKAMAPASAGAFGYAYPLFTGGMPYFFWYAYPGIEEVAEVPPVDQAAAPNGVNPVQLSRAGVGRVGTNLYHLEDYQNTSSGGYMAHDDLWWQQRDPIYGAQAIAKADVPVLLTSGPGDNFNTGALRMYAALQNAAHGRSVWGPMKPGQRPDRRFQVLWGNGYTDGAYQYYLDYELQWYDHWLKGNDNGVAHNDETMHVQVTGGDQRWVSIPRGTYPFTRSYTPYYLAPNNALSGTAPKSAATDSLSWAPGQSLTYTAPAPKAGTTLAGPMTATIYAASTSPDVELLATLNDVAPDGTTTTVPGIDGALIGTARAVDKDRSWTDSAGRFITPFHPFTTTSEKPVPTGEVVRYDVEMVPRMWSVQPGHKLQLVLTSQNAEIEPTTPQLQGLAGGTYTIQRGGAKASHINLPLLPLNAFARAADPTKEGLG